MPSRRRQAPGGARDRLVDERCGRAESASAVRVGDESRAVVGERLETHQGSQLSSGGPVDLAEEPCGLTVVLIGVALSRGGQADRVGRGDPRQRANAHDDVVRRRGLFGGGELADLEVLLRDQTAVVRVADVAASGANGSHEARVTRTSPRRRPVRWMASRRRDSRRGSRSESALARTSSVVSNQVSELPVHASTSRSSVASWSTQAGSSASTPTGRTTTTSMSERGPASPRAVDPNKDVCAAGTCQPSMCSRSRLNRRSRAVTARMTGSASRCSRLSVKSVDGPAGWA